MRDNGATAFEHTHVPYGEDNKLVRGVIARCGNPNCSRAISLPVNTFNQGYAKSEPHIEWGFIARKLEAKGWRIGKSRGSHRCPRCFSAARVAAVQKSKEAHMNGTPIPTPPKVVAENVRTMGREDRRLIFDKLNQVYVDAKVGYSPGWTDEKVAVDLGCPRAWVRLIRDENFGDEVSNENIRAEVAAAQTFLSDFRKFEPDIKALLQRADKIERTLIEIQKVFR